MTAATTPLPRDRAALIRILVDTRARLITAEQQLRKLDPRHLHHTYDPDAGTPTAVLNATLMDTPSDPDAQRHVNELIAALR